MRNAKRSHVSHVGGSPLLYTQDNGVSDSVLDCAVVERDKYLGSVLHVTKEDNIPGGSCQESYVCHAAVVCHPGRKVLLEGRNSLLDCPKGY